MLTHANLLAEADAVFAWAHIGPDDAILGVLPLFHVLSQMANLLIAISRRDAGSLSFNPQYDGITSRLAGKKHHRVCRRTAIF